MLYKQQGSGPWGGGPWGGNGGGNKPWGGRPGGGGGAPPPDLEELLRNGQERLRRLLPNGLDNLKGLWLLVTAAIVVWGLSGIYFVQPDEQGVELLFGRYVKTTQPGANYWFPAPIGEVIRPKVTQTNQVTVGFRGSEPNVRAVPQESHMLAGDQNIADVWFVVQWRIRDAGDFLFNMRDPEGTVKVAAESAVREVVGRNPLQAVMTNQRELIAQDSRDHLQTIMDGYGAGITILDLRIQKADPPAEVIDAFNEVQRAKQDEERLRNEALAYRNDIIPRAKGEAARMVEGATAEREKLIREAEGQASRFTAFYETYVANKDITVRRMYLEAMQEVLGRSEIIMMDDSAGSGVVPYLALPEIQRRSQVIQSQGVDQ
ncbi:MAG: FtsH protease activity modulator HflK [Candidatus Marinimicrobia bacterium]|nr:FtsH protease activity modulator HflK [Candidatus Neomarinimicrobiota bacterium]